MGALAVAVRLYRWQFGKRMMGKVAQSADDLRRHLAESVGFLEVSSAAFDGGSLAEAKRLATTLRVLAHDVTGKSVSLLHQLGIKDSMRFISTVGVDRPGNVAPYHGLVGIRLGGGVTFRARLANVSAAERREHPFDRWWNEVVIDNRAGTVLTRKDLILALANKDGGAHVDPELQSSYAALTRAVGVGWIGLTASAEGPVLEVELHSARQVAFEMLESLRASGVLAP